jgi:predicted amidohydrolase
MTAGLRVGLAQWTSHRDPGVNLSTAESAVRELGRRGCRLAVLPELWRDADAGLVLHPSAYEAAAQTWWDTIYPAQALCNGQWWIAANQHGGAGADRMLGGSRVIAPDGRTVASAPRHRDLVSTPELLVADLAVHDELAAAAAAGGVLWSARPQPSPPPRPEGRRKSHELQIEHRARGAGAPHHRHHPAGRTARETA